MHTYIYIHIVNELSKESDNFTLRVNSPSSSEYNLFKLITCQSPIEFTLDQDNQNSITIFIYKNNKSFANAIVPLLSLQNWITFSIIDNSNLNFSTTHKKRSSLNTYMSNTIMSTTNNLVLNLMSCFKLKIAMKLPKRTKSNNINNNNNNNDNSLNSSHNNSINVLSPSNNNNNNSGSNSNTHKKKTNTNQIKSSLGKFYPNLYKHNQHSINSMMKNLNFNNYYTTTPNISHSNNNIIAVSNSNNSNSKVKGNNSLIESQNLLSHSYCGDNSNTNTFNISHSRSNSNNNTISNHNKSNLGHSFSLSKANSTKNISKNQTKPKILKHTMNCSVNSSKPKTSKSKPTFIKNNYSLISTNNNNNNDVTSTPNNITINNETSPSFPQTSRFANLIEREKDSFVISEEDLNEDSPHLNSNNNPKSVRHFNELKNDFIIFYTNEYVPSISNDLLKLECELCIDKSLELFKAYHTELSELKLRNETYREIYIKWSKRYLNIKQKFFDLQIEKEKNQISTFYKMYIIKTNVTQCKEIDIKTNKNELVIINNILHEQNEKKLYIKNKLHDILIKVCSTYTNEVNALENNNIKEYALNMLLLRKQQQQQQQQQQSKSKSNGILKHSNSGNNYKPLNISKPNTTGSYNKHVYSSNNNVNNRKPKQHSLKNKSNTKYKSFYHNSISSNK